MTPRNAILPLAKLTLTEIPRQPGFLLLVTTLLLFIGSLPFLLTHNLGEPGKPVRDSAMAVMFLGALLVSATASCSAVGGEIRRGTAGAILSKPISRTRFLMAKFLGVAAVMLVFALLCTLALIMADRAASRPFRIHWPFLLPIHASVAGGYLLAALINYFTRRPFGSTAFWAMAGLLLLAFFWTLTQSGAPRLDPQTAAAQPDLLLDTLPVRWALFPACLLLTLAALMLQSLAMFCALRLPIVPTLTLCGGLFLLGLMSDYLLAARAATQLWARLLYILLPNWQHFWMADALAQNGTIPWDYVLHAGGYALSWTLGLFCLTLAAFERMEVR